MLAFRFLGPPVLFRAPKPGPTVCPTALGVSLAMLWSVAMPTIAGGED